MIKPHEAETLIQAVIAMCGTSSKASELLRETILLIQQQEKMISMAINEINSLARCPNKAKDCKIFEGESVDCVLCWRKYLESEDNYCKN